MNAEGPQTDGDEKLIDALRGALTEAEPMPPEVVEAAKAAWTWRTIDAELAQLMHDSTVDDLALAGVRGAATVRTLGFSAGSWFVELEVAEDGERRTILGQITPAGGAALLLEGADGRPPMSTPVDELGRFTMAHASPGLVRLRTPDGGFVTEWVTI